jgi:hypothetical protein
VKRLLVGLAALVVVACASAPKLTPKEIDLAAASCAELDELQDRDEALRLFCDTVLDAKRAVDAARAAAVLDAGAAGAGGAGGSGE